MPPLASETALPARLRRRNLPLARKAADALFRIKLQSIDNDTHSVREKADSISIFMDSAAASFSPVQQSSVNPSPPVPGPPHGRAAISGPPCGRHKMSELPHKACTASGQRKESLRLSPSVPEFRCGRKSRIARRIFPSETGGSSEDAADHRAGRGVLPPAGAKSSYPGRMPLAEDAPIRFRPSSILHT